MASQELHMPHDLLLARSLHYDEEFVEITAGLPSHQVELAVGRSLMASKIIEQASLVHIVQDQADRSNFAGKGEVVQIAPKFVRTSDERLHALNIVGTYQSGVDFTGGQKDINTLIGIAIVNGCWLGAFSSGNIGRGIDFNSIYNKLVRQRSIELPVFLRMSTKMGNDATNYIQSNASNLLADVYWNIDQLSSYDFRAGKAPALLYQA